MCGIAGFLSWGEKPADNRVLSRMATALRHRGPDDEGFALLGENRFRLYSGPETAGELKAELPPLSGAPQSRCGMAFRRLSIQDLSTCGHQPMLSADGQIALVFNGEIYNFQHLRTELQQAGYAFISRTDTEVILAGYVLYGISFLQRLNGMFAMAIFDNRLQQLFLIRDRLGIKPLHYAQRGPVLFWASEIKALLATGYLQPQPRWDGLYSAFRLEAAPAPATCFEDIYALPAGCYLEINTCTGHSRQHQYWDIPFPGPRIRISRQEAGEELAVRLQRIVASQIISDAPALSMMSGGIDSTLLTALCARLAPGWHAYTMSFAPELHAFNELPQAQIAARHFGIIHEADEATGADLSALLPLALGHYEQPYASIDPQLLAARFLHRRRYKVIINGAGADELFGGYAYYHTWQHWLKRKKLAWAAPFLPPVGHTLNKVKTVLALKDIADFYWHQRGGLRPRAWQALFGTAIKPALPALPEHLSEWPLEEAIAYLDLKHNIGNHHCFREDLAYMAFSVESRYPFLDHELVAWAATLPTDVRFSLGENKTLVRAAAGQYLPPAVLQMPKKGFNLPLAEWVLQQKELEALAGQKIKNLKRRGIFQNKTIDKWWQQRRHGLFDRVWLLVNTETWLETYFDDAR